MKNIESMRHDMQGTRVKRLHRSAGFTLIEVLVAVLILVVGLLEMVGLTSTVIKSNTASKASTTATTLAGQKLEEVKNTDYTAMVNGTSTDYATSSGTVQAGATGAYYTRVATIATDQMGTTTDTSDDMKNVTVTVSWGTNHQVVLSSKVAQ